MRRLPLPLVAQNAKRTNPRKWGLGRTACSSRPWSAQPKTASRSRPVPRVIDFTVSRSVGAVGRRQGNRM